MTTTTPDDTSYTTSYQYRADGLLWKVWDPFNPIGQGGSTPTEYTYDDAGRLKTRTLPNGVLTTWTFDLRDRLLSIVHEDSSSNVISSFTYEHPQNAVGEPHKITREDGSYVELDYDPALRLKQERYYDSNDMLLETITYDYDNAGNRTARTDATGTSSYAPEAASDYLLDTVTGPSPIDDLEYDYDSGGRLIERLQGVDDWDFTYNAAGQVTNVSRLNDTDLSYEYDAVGRRTQASVGPTNVRFLIAPAAQRLGTGALDVEVQHASADSNGDLVTGWVYAGENPILRYDENGNIEYYLEDASDSIAALINPSATKTADYRYDGFGNMRAGSFGELYNLTPTDATGEFGYHGAWLDQESGLYHMRARSYDPETGRFLTPDPAEPNPQVPETYNPYSFANNNPHLYSDPTGLFSTVEISVGSSIQSNLSKANNILVQRAQKYAIDELQEFATELFVEQLGNLIPLAIPEFARGIIAAGNDFEGKLEKAFARTLPGFASYFWFQPNIDPSSGRVLNSGFNGHDILRGLKNRSTISSRPDYLINPDDPRSPDADYTWLVGDFALTAQTLYSKYIDKGKQVKQWEAITSHASNYGIRLSAFFTFYAATLETAEGIRNLMIREGLEKGDLVFIFSIKNTNKAKLSWER